MVAPVGMPMPSSGNNDDQPFSWDDVVRLAAYAFEVPMAFVRVGDEWTTASAEETLASSELQAFFRRLGSVERPFVIEDVVADSRIGEAETPVRFVAAVRVRDVDRRRTGMLGLADVVPREFSEAEASHLRVLGTLAGARRRLIEPLAGHALEAIVQHAEQGVVVTDRRERIRWVNEGFVRLCGYTLEELYDRKPRDLLQGPATDPDTLAAIREHVQADEGFTAEVVNYRKNGEPYWVRIDAEPIAAEDAAPAGFIAFEADVSQQKMREQQLQVERDTLRTALDTAGLPIVLLDREGRILRFSEACRRLTGYEAEEVVGERMVDRLVPEDEHATVEAVLRAHRAGERHGTCTCHWMSRTGERRLIEWTTTALMDAQGNVAYLIGTGTDRTERRRIERAALTVSNAERQRLGQDLYDLLASPLMGAAMMARGAEQRVEQGQYVERKELHAIVERIKQTAGQVQALVQALLASARLHSEELGAALQRLATQKEAQTGVAVGADVPSDLPAFDDVVATYLYRIAHEALHGALLYAAPEHVWVRLAYEHGNVVLTVRDDGLRGDETGERGVGVRFMRQCAAVIGATLQVERPAERGTTVRCEIAVGEARRPSNG